MTKAGFHVPPGFALGVEAYERFMKETEATERLLEFLKTFKADPDKVADTLKFEAASQGDEGIVESIKMPPDMEETVQKLLWRAVQDDRKREFICGDTIGRARKPSRPV